MTIQQIMLLLTGLVLFLFGMIKLSAEMQRIFSVRIRQYIKKMVKKPIRGVILGAMATAIFQSSSATTVLTVGVVSAGLISFFSSLGILLGADIGTTITAQLVAFKITAIAPIFIIFGICVWFIGKDKVKSVGETIFYFGLLFFGLGLMGDAIAPLKQSQTFITLLQQAKNPFWGVSISFIFTSIVQSSSVTTGILVLLAQKGLITIESGLPLILGANIGTTITAFLASIGSQVSGKRVAMSHFLFKFLAVALVLPFLKPFASFLKFLTPNVTQQIVLGHFLFNIGLVCIFFFLLKPFSKLIKKIIPGKENVLPLWPEYLDNRYLSQPALALEAVRKELQRGALLTQEMFFKATEIIFKFSGPIFNRVAYIELVIDNLQKEVMNFLGKISKEKLTKNEAAKLIQYSAIVDNIERLADHATNLAKLAKHKDRNKIKFSKEGMIEIEELKEILIKNIRDASMLIKERDEQKIQDILQREYQVNKMVEQAKAKHLERFYNRECAAADGPIFNDIMINFERISDHCVNITEYYKSKG